MGNTTNAHPLPQIWQRISSLYLRNRLTHEIIQQHTLYLTTQQQLTTVISSLKKRISLHHTSIPKVIYFTNQHQDSICGQFNTNYQVSIYTQYAGDTLQEILQEKNEKLTQIVCPCNQIFNAIEYLKDYYDFFIINTNMIFLGNKKERNIKIWINSKLQFTQRQIPSNQQQMQSIIKNKICKHFSIDQMQQFQKIRKLSEMKHRVNEIHQKKQFDLKHKKYNSVFLLDKEEFKKVNQMKRLGEGNKKIYMNKANSMPQKRQQTSVMNRTIQIIPLKTKDHNQQLQINPNHNSNPNPKSSSQLPLKPKNIPSSSQNNIFTRPPSHSFKINFTYSQEVDKQKPQKPLNNSLDKPLQIKQYKILQNLPLPKIQNLFNSVQSRDGLESNGHSFTAREMQLPLNQTSQKITPARLPTTSRSPKILHDTLQNINNNTKQQFFKPKFTKPAINTQKTQSKNNKFQKYKSAIKDYQQKLKSKLANTLIDITKKQKLLIKNPSNHHLTSKNPAIKQTKSLYNESKDNSEQNLKQSPQPQPSIKTPIYQMESQQSIPGQGQQISNKILREHLQKLQLDHQLQKQKLLIKNQLQDLLKQNTIKDEYRSIREKIKQKKQTFAQLKAQATKILQDLQY